MGKVVGFDLDGVLYQWHESVYEYFQCFKGYEGTFSDFWTVYIPSLSKDEQTYIVSLPFLYENKIPLESTLELLEFCNKNTDGIYYITFRPLDLERVTQRYIRKYFPQPENLFITGDKVTMSRYLGITHFIDDRDYYVRDISGIADSYLMAKPWNREFQSELKTVHSLKEFQERIFA
jgi:hypothetical protein